MSKNKEAIAVCEFLERILNDHWDLDMCSEDALVLALKESDNVYELTQLLDEFIVSKL